MAIVRKINGVWYLDYYDALGKRHRKRAKIQNKKWADKKLRKILEEIDRGVVDGSRVRFKAYAETWLDRRLPALKSGTWVTYKGQINVHLLDKTFGLGDWPLPRITRGTCEDFKAALMVARKLKPRTINSILTLLGTILQDALRDGLIQSNPARLVEKLREPHREMDYLRAHEVGDLLLAAPTISPQANLLVLVAVTAGLRRGEILALRWMDLDLKGRSINVCRNYVDGAFTEPKTARSLRKVPIPAQTLRALLESRMFLGNPPGDALIFDRGDGRPMDPDTASKRIWHQVRLAAGIRESVRFHDLRHTYASLLLLQGENLKTIQALMGHSSITVTMDRYAHLSPATAQEAADRLSDTLGFPTDDEREGASSDS